MAATMHAARTRAARGTPFMRHFARHFARPLVRPFALRLEWLIAAALVAAVVTAAAVSRPDWGDFVSAKVGLVRLEGDYRHLDRFRVERIFERLYELRLFAVDLHAVERAFEDIPWVRHATVRRIWPATLQVELEEYEAVAYWGRDALLSTDGEIFTPPLSKRRELPLFEAPPGRERAVLAFYRGLAPELEAVGARIAALREDERRSWSVQLAGGPHLTLGRSDLAGRVRRFIGARRAGFAGFTADTCVDLRYADGFALRERGERPC